MKKLIIAALAFALAALPASAQVPYPTSTGAVQSQNASNTGADTTSLAAALPAVAGKTTYVCGIFVGGLGATAATTVNATVGAVISAQNVNLTYTFPTGATVASTPLQVNFNPCLPGAGTNIGITLTVPGAAGNTSTIVDIWGFAQ